MTEKMKGPGKRNPRVMPDRRAAAASPAPVRRRRTRATGTLFRPAERRTLPVQQPMDARPAARMNEAAARRHRTGAGRWTGSNGRLGRAAWLRGQATPGRHRSLPDPEAPVGMGRQGAQRRALVALEAVRRRLPRRAAPACVGGALQPARRLFVEIVVDGKRAVIQEAVVDVADRHRQHGKLRKTRADDPLVRIQLVGHCSLRRCVGT